MSPRDRSWIRHARIIELTHGATASPDEFRKHLERLRPDAIHLIGCTHDGVVNYRSRIGPGAADDSLLLQQMEIARALGIKIIGSHSGVGNRAAGDAHPEWIRIRSDGSRSPQTFAGWQMDLLSPYPEAWFLPQVEEMLRDYGIDGLWVDGDCWYVYPCYSEPTLARFRAETGYEAPRIDDSQYPLFTPTASGAVITPALGDTAENRLDPEELARIRAWLAFTRQVFREFQRKTGELCHRYGAIYASNGTHSVDSGPDPVPEWMDYLSHDIPAFESSGSFMASIKARFNDTQGVPHDVMTWDFNSRNPWGGYQTYPKGRKQFFQEIGSALANGAIWNNWTSRPHDAIAWEVSDFIHQHRDLLSGTHSLAEIAILHSAASYYVHSGGLFTTKAGNKPVWGAARALQRSGHHFDLVSEANLPRHIDRYRLIILAGQSHLPPETLDLLARFVQRGGRLLVTGRSGYGDGDTQALAEILGLEPALQSGDNHLTVAACPEWLAEVDAPEGAGPCVLQLDTPRLGIVPSSAEVVACALVDAHGRTALGTGWTWASQGIAPDPTRPWVTHHTWGQGHAWAIAADLFGHYEKHQYFGLGHLIAAWVDRILPDPLARARAERPVEISLRAKEDGRLICHLVNLNVEAMNNSVETQYQRHVPVSPVEVSLRLPTKPTSVTLARTSEALPCSYADGILRFVLAELDVLEPIIITGGSF